jgi:hypothetical protein
MFPTHFCQVSHPPHDHHDAQAFLRAPFLSVALETRRRRCRSRHCCSLYPALYVVLVSCLTNMRACYTLFCIYTDEVPATCHLSDRPTVHFNTYAVSHPIFCLYLFICGGLMAMVLCFQLWLFHCFKLHYPLNNGP